MLGVDPSHLRDLFEDPAVDPRVVTRMVAAVSAVASLQEIGVLYVAADVEGVDAIHADMAAQAAGDLGVTVVRIAGGRGDPLVAVIPIDVLGRILADLADADDAAEVAQVVEHLCAPGNGVLRVLAIRPQGFSYGRVPVRPHAPN